MKNKTISETRVENIGEYQDDDPPELAEQALLHCHELDAFLENRDWQAWEQLSGHSSAAFRQRCHEILSDSSRQSGAAVTDERAAAMPPEGFSPPAGPSPDPALKNSQRIAYLLETNGWTESELARQLAAGAPAALSPATLHSWRRGDVKPPRHYLQQIEQLCLRAALRVFGSPGGLQYVCNLSRHYGQDQSVRAAEAVERLNAILIRECPRPASGALSITVFKAELPEGVRAQCFRSAQDPPCFVILVREGPDWMADARDEIFAHVLTLTGSGPIEIKER
jgi:hypothetical protein